MLIYSSDAPEKVKEYQKYGKERVADLLEGATAYIARRAVQAGIPELYLPEEKRPEP